jgi:hypothetical protein
MPLLHICEPWLSAHWVSRQILLGALCRKQETIDPVDDEYARRDCVCRELERIDELRAPVRGSMRRLPSE